MKKYLDIDVYDAFCKRIEYIFSEFELVYLSVSGGKDSSVMVQLTNEIAKKLNRTFDVFYIDFEAQYTATINHIYELKGLSQIRDFYHFCLPLENEDNPNSIFEPVWVPWAEKDKAKWVRPMPKDAININNVDSEIFQRGQEWEDILKNFPRFLKKKYNADKVACLVGNRADESNHRFNAVAFGKNLYKDINYSTKLPFEVYSFYPLYDWATEDIWHAVHKFKLKYNKVYEAMWQLGVSIHEQRICQPFGIDQRVSLNQWAKIEPETWTRVVNRVSGTNFGNIYAKSSLLGHNGTEKPDFMTWEEYAVFLLESLGLYSPELEAHYVRKIRILFDYLKEEGDIDRKDIQEEDKSKPDNLKDWISWKRIAKTLEKNDFACRNLQYGLTLKDREEMKVLRDKWGKLLGIENYNTKDMKELAKELGYE
ncbi:DUF3440 domain-containing protein [Riemerella anatipestifer]|nr:DUF3440 domain-containing protein [Riemerella anatipestifer]